MQGSVMSASMLPASLEPLGLGDCEAIGNGLLAQPVNALSSAAYLLVGLGLMIHVLRSRTTDRAYGVAFGAAVASVGIGSFAYHGPQPPGARLLHDLTIAAAFSAVVAHNLGRWHRLSGRAPHRRPRAKLPTARRLLGTGLLFAGAAGANLLGRTGGPLCEPGSLLQPHAVWHLLTAAALATYGRAAFPSSAAAPG